jgi:hypothetical protein
MISLQSFSISFYLIDVFSTIKKLWGSKVTVSTITAPTKRGGKSASSARDTKNTSGCQNHLLCPSAFFHHCIIIYPKTRLPDNHAFLLDIFKITSRDPFQAADGLSKHQLFSKETSWHDFVPPP